MRQVSLDAGSTPFSVSLAVPAKEIIPPARYKIPLPGDVITGTGRVFAVTDKVASLLNASPTAFDTWHRKTFPLSLSCVFTTVYEGELVSEILTPFTNHWDVSGSFPETEIENSASS